MHSEVLSGYCKLKVCMFLIWGVCGEYFKLWPFRWCRDIQQCYLLFVILLHLELLHIGIIYFNNHRCISMCRIFKFAQHSNGSNGYVIHFTCIVEKAILKIKKLKAHSRLAVWYSVMGVFKFLYISNQPLSDNISYFTQITICGSPVVTLASQIGGYGFSFGSQHCVKLVFFIFLPGVMGLIHLTWVVTGFFPCVMGLLDVTLRMHRGLGLVSQNDMVQ